METAASVLTRVRVERLVNIRAIVWARSLSLRLEGIEPDLTAVLFAEALRTRVTSSCGVRSEMERKCRGEKGEGGGVEGVEGETL